MKKRVILQSCGIILVGPQSGVLSVCRRQKAIPCMIKAVKGFFGGLFLELLVYFCMDAIIGIAHNPFWTWGLGQIINLGIYMGIRRRFTHIAGWLIGGLCLAAMAWLSVILLGNMSFATEPGGH